MRAAVAYADGKVNPHFSETKQFKLYDIENGVITRDLLMNTGVEGNEAIAGFLSLAGVNVVICGAISGNAQAALIRQGITYWPGAVGNADDAAKALADGTLHSVINSPCAHHHEHAEGGCESCTEDCAFHEGGAEGKETK